jgi:protein TonB
VFEQSILLNHDANRPWNFVVSLSVELLIVSLAFLIPLAYSDHLPAFHWDSVAIRPAPAPIPLKAALTKSPAATSTSLMHAAVIHRPFLLDRDVRTPLQPAAAAALEGEAPPSIGGLSVGAGLGPSGAVVIVTPTRPPPPRTVATSSAPIRVGGSVQMAKLIRKVIPEYPALAKAARISGVVHLIGTIAKDGTIRNLQLIGGHPMLARAAMEAVQQWVYEPTLLNGEPVEVIAPIEVSFTLGR